MTHNYSRLFYHFIWATWDRTPLLVNATEETAYAVMRSQCTELGVKMMAIGGIENHVHLLVNLPATLTVAEFVKSVKGVSSRTLNQTYDRPAWSFKWQGRYGVHTVGPSQVSLITHYVENQKQHHADGTLWPSSEKIEEADRALLLYLRRQTIAFLKTQISNPGNERSRVNRRLHPLIVSSRKGTT